MPRAPAPDSLYARTWRAVRSRGSHGAAIVVGSVMHAAGHAFLAAAAGVLARALAWGPAPMDAGSTFVLPVSGFPDFAVLPLAIAGVFAA
ncbi:MAG: hypothetical protein KF850_18235, partial [Labilithrix sp.]|nr:hypothetical protein [Labilithrix sp.]